jgi:sec-independent protein translocase protein TatA
MGAQEWILLAVIAFVLFGPKKLPELAKGLGEGIREFKRAMSESTQEPAAPAPAPSPPAPASTPPAAAEPVETPKTDA